MLIIVKAVRFLLKTNAGMAGSLVALLVFSCFSYPFSVLPFLIVFVFLIAWNPTMNPTVETGHVPSLHVPSLRRTMPVAVILIAVTTFCLWKQYPVYKSYKEWNKSRIYYHSGLYKEITESYKPLYPYLNDQIQFLFEYGRSLSNAGQYEESNKVFRRAAQISCDPMIYNIMGKNCQAMKEYQQAENYFIHAARIVPNRLYPWYLLAKLYDEMGLPDKVRETAAIVQTKEPKVQSTAIREMREEVLKLKTKK